MRRIKTTLFIALTAASALVLALSFTPLAGGETNSEANDSNFVPTNVFPESVRVEALEILASGYFNEMSSAGQMRVERMAGARMIDGVITPYDFSAPGVPFNREETGSPNTSSFVDPLVNNPSADTTTRNTQSETAIVLGSGNNVVSSFNDSGSNVGGANQFTGYSTSANSGTTWTDRGTLPTAVGNGDAGDPVLARNNTTGTILFGTLNFNLAQRLNIYRSTDNGVTFGPAIIGTPGYVGAAGNHDKEWLAVDNFAGPGNGNAYLFWRNFGTSGGMTLTRSTDDGLTWGPSPGLILAASTGQGAQVAVGPDHSVYCEWLASGPNRLLIRRSTDQGVTFAAATTVTSLLSTGTNGDLALNTGGAAPSFRSSTFPQLAVNPVSGILYTVYPDNPAGVDKADVFFRQSTDNGTTWSAAVRVNTDTGTNDNWMPSLAVTPDGTGLFVGFYDRRRSVTNNRIEYWGRTASISGSVVTFDCDFPISSSDFPVVVGVDPAINTTYMGDYDMATASNTHYYVQWGDNRSGNPDVRFALVPKEGDCGAPTPPPTLSISGTVSYCSNPVPGPVPNVTMTRTGTSGGSTVTNGSGIYTFTGLVSGGNYTITPSKTALAPGTNGIDGADVVAATRHFLELPPLLSAGCQLDAADADTQAVGVSGADIVAIQRFYLGLPNAPASRAGQYRFTPANRSYSPLVSNQTAQNYDALIYGDVTDSFVHRPERGPSQDKAGGGTNEAASTVTKVALPEMAVEASESNLMAAITTSAIDARNKLVGFQGNITFDERVVTLDERQPVQKAGLTAGNWNVSGHVLPGPGPIRTLRLLGYSNDFTPLSGEGTLFELRMTRVKAGEGTALNWTPNSQSLLFIDGDSRMQPPGNAASGSVNSRPSQQ